MEELTDSEDVMAVQNLSSGRHVILVKGKNLNVNQTITVIKN